MATQEDIEFHYDLDNDFFALFLDKRHRGYSSGVWEHASNLEDAQDAKFMRLCNYANIQPNYQVLDIGSGWGGFMNLVATRYEGAKAHGLTISREQLDYVNENKHPNVSVELCPWQSYSSPKRKFDALVSVEVFEHFATQEEYVANKQRDLYREFFEWCLSVSTDDALFALQTIVITRLPKNLTELKGSKYLQEVFPGSAMASISDIQAGIQDKYEIFKADTIASDYVLTLKEWNKRLHDNERLVVDRYGQELFDHFDSYFTGAASCFETGYLNVVQLSLKRAKTIRVFT